jgi:hypothetical protein
MHVLRYSTRIALAVLAAATTASGRALDQYLGFVDLHDENRVTGQFTLGQDDDGRYWLWTPEGNAFFGLGVNKMSSHWISAFNPDGWQADYHGNRWEWGEAQRNTLLDWSFNSIAYMSHFGGTDDEWVYGDPRLYRHMDMPFVENIFFVAHGDIAYHYSDPEKFLNDRYPDVWSPEWIEEADLRAERVVSRVHTSPYLIGYNLGNEPWTSTEYYYQPIWADYIIARDRDAPGKAKWVDMMQERYGTPEQFNAAYADELEWGIASFDDLYDVTRLQMNWDDAAEFTTRLLDQYARISSSKIHKYDPDHLIVGARLMISKGNTNRSALDAFAPYVDAFSFNSYDQDPNLFDLIYERYQKPILISETSYLADDTGYANDPYPRVPDQVHRGMAYREAITDLAAKPYIVGVWWHAYYDHGPNNHVWANWGLIDPLQNLPYYDFIDFVSETNSVIYDIHTGLVSRAWWRVNLRNADPDKGN